MFYKLLEPTTATLSPLNPWEKIYRPVRDFASRIRLNIRIRWDGILNTPFSGDEPSTARDLGLVNLGVANRSEYVYPHYAFVDPADEIHSACSGILRLGKKGTHTVLWCPRCATIVRQPDKSQKDDAFLLGLGITPS